MRYLSVCSGIEAASCAWHWLGWEPAGFAEIEDFPSAVLAHRYPGVKNHGDFTRIARSPELVRDIGPIDVLVGGTPCQSFSVAGLRGGLSDERGNLALEFFRLAEATRPRWILWENVPGVLSSGDGRDYGAILGAMAYLGYGYAWRVLDAQFFGVPQRRRRVFLVGHSGGSCDGPATVLFEPEGVQRHPPQKRQARKEAAPAAPASPGERGEHSAEIVPAVTGALTARYGGQAMGAPEVDAGLYIPSQKWPAEKTCTLNTLYGTKMGLEDQHVFAGASMFVPALSPAVTSKWAKGSGGPAGDERQNLVAAPVMPALDTRAGRSGETTFATSGGLVPVGFNWQNGGGYGAAHDGLGITEDGVPPLSRSQTPAVAFQSNLSNQAVAAGDMAPCLAANSPVAVAFQSNMGSRGDFIGMDVSPTLRVGAGSDRSSGNPPAVTAPMVTHALTANGFDASEDGTGRGTPLVAAVRETGRNAWTQTEAAGTLDGHAGTARPALVLPFDTTQLTHPVNRSSPKPGDPCHPLAAGAHPPAVALQQNVGVRRLTPRECERLQGFPDDWTLIEVKPGKMAADGPRYKALGNSMAVPVMYWIGKRIAQVDVEGPYRGSPPQE